jgi:Secretory lipase
MEISLRITSGIVALACAAVGTISHDVKAATHPGRGTVVSSARVAHLSLAQTRQYLQSTGFASPQAKSAVDVYRVVYRTINAQGRPTTASGVVALPQTSKRSLHVVDFEHGTMVAKSDAPSTEADDRGEVTMFAGAGYAAVEPDYLGLGLGPGHHPYVDPTTEATASADMLRAARTVAARHGRKLDPKVMVSGFSQGGQAAMATARALQSGAVRDFRLAAVAGVSGPYDIQHAQVPVALAGHPLDPRASSFYLGYWVTAMNSQYHLYNRPSEVFLPPYDKTAEPLFDGLHSDQAVFDGVPATPQKLFTKAFLRRLAHPSGELLKLERADDTTCTAWTPRVPVRLYMARGDTQVSNLNSQHCLQALHNHGVNASLTDVGAVDHFPSEHLALPQALNWFEHLQPA